MYNGQIINPDSGPDPSQRIAVEVGEDLVGMGLHHVDAD